ncbi:MAG TPA: hypothetical protein VF627_00100 [Abditibacterium sp.]|jgi:hypothetical protein
MLSFRGWTSRSQPWQALVFWVWLSGFAFSFAASDVLHSPHCAQRLALERAGHAASDSSQLAWHEAAPFFQTDGECAACFQVAAAILAVATPLFFAPMAQIEFARPARWLLAARALTQTARGPPLSLHSISA